MKVVKFKDGKYGVRKFSFKKFSYEFAIKNLLNNSAYWFYAPITYIGQGKFKSKEEATDFMIAIKEGNSKDIGVPIDQ